MPTTTEEKPKAPTKAEAHAALVERARDKMSLETEDMLRTMLRKEDAAVQLSDEIVTMHLKVKILTDRLQLGPLHHHPHVLALIAVMAGGDEG